MSGLTRRQFLVGAGLTGLGLLAGCGRWPGQQATSLSIPRIGYLMPLSAKLTAPATEAFLQGLRDAGYIEGRNILIEYRYADGRQELLPELAAELVNLPVQVLITSGAGIYPARSVTTTIPIVMTNQSDPVGSADVSSLARPAGNVTGLSQAGALIVGKRLELLKEAIPGITRVAVLGVFPQEFREAQAAADMLGVRLQPLDAAGAADLSEAFEAAARQHADALLTIPGPVTLENAQQIARLAIANRLPTMNDGKSFVIAGGLMAYGPDRLAMFHRAAYYVDRILRGTKPADLPVEQPMTFEFVVNLKTAQALGITFPNEIMLQVTEVIQ